MNYQILERQETGFYLDRVTQRVYALTEGTYELVADIKEDKLFKDVSELEKLLEVKILQ